MDAEKMLNYMEEPTRIEQKKWTNKYENRKKLDSIMKLFKINSNTL